MWDTISGNMKYTVMVNGKKICDNQSYTFMLKKIIEQLNMLEPTVNTTIILKVLVN